MIWAAAGSITWDALISRAQRGTCRHAVLPLQQLSPLQSGVQETHEYVRHTDGFGSEQIPESCSRPALKFPTIMQVRDLWVRFLVLDRKQPVRNQKFRSWSSVSVPNSPFGREHQKKVERSKKVNLPGHLFCLNNLCRGPESRTSSRSFTWSVFADFLIWEEETDAERSSFPFLHRGLLKTQNRILERDFPHVSCARESSLAQIFHVEGLFFLCVKSNSISTFKYFLLSWLHIPFSKTKTLLLRMSDQMEQCSFAESDACTKTTHCFPESKVERNWSRRKQEKSHILLAVVQMGVLKAPSVVVMLCFPLLLRIHEIRIDLICSDDIHLAVFHSVIVKLAVKPQHEKKTPTAKRNFDMRIRNIFLTMVVMKQNVFSCALLGPQRVFGFHLSNLSLQLAGKCLRRDQRWDLSQRSLWRSHGEQEANSCDQIRLQSHNSSCNKAIWSSYVGVLSNFMVELFDEVFAEAFLRSWHRNLRAKRQQLWVSCHEMQWSQLKLPSAFVLLCKISSQVPILLRLVVKTFKNHSLANLSLIVRTEWKHLEYEILASCCPARKVGLEIYNFFRVWLSEKVANRQEFGAVDPALRGTLCGRTGRPPPRRVSLHDLGLLPDEASL